MKKMFLICMCLVLLAGTALSAGAEDTSASVTMYASGEGYTILYPADRLVPTGEYGHAVFVPADGSGDASLMIVATDIPFENMETMLDEAVGGYGAEYRISEPVIRTVYGAMVVGTVQAEANGRVDRFYAVSNGGSLLCVTAGFSADSDDGAMFDAMVKSIVISADAAQLEEMDAVYEGEGYTILYPSARVRPAQQYGHDTFVPVSSGEGDFSVSMMLVDAEVAAEDAYNLLTEATAGWGEDAQIYDMTERTGANGVSLYEVNVLSGGIVTRYTLAIDGDRAMCVTATVPKRDPEGFLAIFPRMVDTIELRQE